MVEEAGHAHADEPLPASLMTTPGPVSRRNWLLHITLGGTTLAASRLASAELILPLLLSALAAPAILLGLLVPVLKAGALLPQIAVAGQIRTFKQRRWLWITSASTRVVILSLMIAAALTLPPTAAGIAIVMLAGAFGMAVSLGILSFLDLYAKTIPTGKRGLMFAQRMIVGGIAALGLGLLLEFYMPDSDSSTPYLVLIAIAAVMWVVSAGVVALMVEDDGPVAPRLSPARELREGVAIWHQYPNFRAYVTSRGLLMVVELALPFFALGVTHYTTATGSGSVGLLMISVAIAEILSNQVWSRYVDRSSRGVLVITSVIGVCAVLGILGFTLLPLGWRVPALYMAPFLLLNFAIAGIRLSSDTYILDAAPETDRPVFMAVRNTILGITGFLGISLGLLADLSGLRAVFALVIVLTALGAGVAWTLPDSAHMLARIPPEQQRASRKRSSRLARSSHR